MRQLEPTKYIVLSHSSATRRKRAACAVESLRPRRLLATGSKDFSPSQTFLFRPRPAPLSTSPPCHPHPHPLLPPPPPLTMTTITMPPPPSYPALRRTGFDPQIFPPRFSAKAIFCCRARYPSNFCSKAPEYLDTVPFLLLHRVIPKQSLGVVIVLQHHPRNRVVDSNVTSYAIHPRVFGLLESWHRMGRLVDGGIVRHVRVGLSFRFTSSAGVSMFGVYTCPSSVP